MQSTGQLSPRTAINFYPPLVKKPQSKKISLTDLHDNLLKVIFLFLDTNSRTTLSLVNHDIAYLATLLHSQEDPMTWKQYQRLTLLSKLFHRHLPLSEIHHFHAYKEKSHPSNDGNSSSMRPSHLNGQILASMPQLCTLNLSDCFGFSRQDFKELESLTQLRLLNLSKCSNYDLDLPCIASFTSLTQLYVSHFSDQGLMQLTHLVHMRLLDLSHCPITDAGLVSLRHLTELETLNLSRRRAYDGSITGSGLIHLTHISTLHTLDLRGCLITPNGAAALGKLTNLHTLNVSYADNIRAVDLLTLSALRILDISYSSINDFDLVHLGALTKLENLNLFNCDISDDALIHLKPLVALQALNLSKSRLDTYPQINGTGLIHLTNCTSLHTLHLARCELSHAGVACLARLSRLQVLNLHEADFPETCVVHLKKLNNLKKLDLSGCKISNHDLDHIQALTTLESLNLSHPIPRNSLLMMYPDGIGASMRYYHPIPNPITSAGIAKLTTLTALRTLTLAGVQDAHQNDKNLLNCIYAMPSLSTLNGSQATLSKATLMRLRDQESTKKNKKATRSWFFW